MKQDWKSVNRVSDSISFLYLEHCHIEQDNFAIKAVSEVGETSINAAGITVLLLGPGTTVTHRAIVSLSECGCSTVWCGEHLRKYYACGFAKTHSAKNLFKQARAYSDKELHMSVVRKLYKQQLKMEDLPLNFTINQLRGWEGQRLRKVYNEASRTFGISWSGRHYKDQTYDMMNISNKALTCAYDLLYSICGAVITAMGYSTGLSFIHSGHINAFSFDIADLFKEDIAIPSAFEAVATWDREVESLEAVVRRIARKYFKEESIMDKLPKILTGLFDDIDAPYKNSEVCGLWTPDGTITGGENYGNLGTN